MWFILDVLLVIQTLFHASHTLAIAVPIDSLLKKALVKAHRRIAAAVDAKFLHLTALVVNLAICVSSIAAGAWDDANMRTRLVVSLLALLSAPVHMKLGHAATKLGSERILELEQEVMNKDILSFTPPSVATLDAAMAPITQLLETEFVGLENVSGDSSHLFVMNHALWGMEMPTFMHTLYKERGVFVRGLADHFHWTAPYAPLLRAFGAVDGTRPNVDLLMEAGQNVLVYPGGGAEVMKSSSVERYTLMWKERLGFARMAIKNKYPILPCACVGTEDMLDIFADIPLKPLLGDKAPVPFFPLVKPNSLQKVYYWFGEPIPTAQYNGDWENTDFAKEVRDKTKAAVEAGIRELRARQASDPDRFLTDRVGQQLLQARERVESTIHSLIEGTKSD